MRGYGVILGTRAAALERDTCNTYDARQNSRRTRLVLLEGGLTGFDAHAPPDESEQTVVIAQGSAEGPRAVAERAVRRIEALQHSGQRIGLAVLVLAPYFDAATTAARLSFGRALITHSAVSSGSELLLSGADGEVCASYQRSLLALVDALMNEPGSASLPIRVQFGGAARGRLGPWHQVAPLSLRRASRRRIFDAAGGLRGASRP